MFSFLLKLFFFILVTFTFIAVNLQSQTHLYDDYNTYKCGTFNTELKLQNVIRSIQNSRLLDKQTKQRLIEKKINGETLLEIPCDEIDRPKMPFKISSKSGIFLIHYDTTGPNAVSTIDSNKNNIPDYIDSVIFYADYIYDIEVNQMGFISPYPDSGGGGSPQLDIYLEDLAPDGVYGFTFSGCEIKHDNKCPRYTSWIKLDNNYSPLDSFQFSENEKKRVYYETSIKALKITIAHEFNHAVQNMYGEQSPPTRSLNEWTSSWLEYRIFPDIKDFMQYMPGLFRNFKARPFGNGNFENGYRWSIFGQYIYRNFRDTIMKRMWELIGECIDGFTSLDSAFKELRTTLAKEWCKFLPWLYYTASRADKGESFDDKRDFPEIHFFNKDTVFIPIVMIDTGSLAPFEVRGLRYYFRGEGAVSDDTLDIMLTNTDTEAAIKQIMWTKPYSLTLASEQITGTIPLGNTKYFWLLDVPEEYYCNYYYLYPGINTCEIDYVYPDPIHLFKENTLYFPAPENAKLYETVVLSIHTIEMLQIYNGTHKIIVNNGCRVIEWKQIPNSISSGIYIYTIKYKEHYKLGKFAIQRHP